MLFHGSFTRQIQTRRNLATLWHRSEGELSLGASAAAPAWIELRDVFGDLRNDPKRSALGGWITRVPQKHFFFFFFSGGKASGKLSPLELALG